jgi:hypothetical protein
MRAIAFIKLTPLIFFLFSVLPNMFSQDHAYYRDRVWLKNNRTIVGELISMDDSVIILQFRSGSVLKLKQEDVKRVAQYASSADFDEMGNLFFQANGHKHIFNAGIGIGFGELFDNMSFSLDAAFHYRYRIKPAHLVGARVSLLSSMTNFGYILPLNTIYADYTWLIRRSGRINPYLSARFGFGSAFSYKNELSSIRHNGFRPGGELAFGMIYSIANRTAFFSEIGFNRQDNTFLFRNNYEIEERFSQRNETLSRLFLLIGFFF